MKLKEIRLTLDEILSKRGITRYELAKMTGIGYAVIHSYYKDRVKRYDKETLLKICLALDCEVGDILRIVECEQDRGP